MAKTLEVVNGSWLAVEVIYLVMANHEVDGVVSGVTNVMRHMQDLVDMECDHVCAFRLTSTNEGWAHMAADEIEDIMRLKPFGRKGMKRMIEDYAERGLNLRIDLVGLAGLRKEMMKRLEAQAIEF